MKQENLNPEIEEKLLQLQRYQEKQMKGGVENSLSSHHNQIHSTPNLTTRTVSRKRPNSASTAHPSPSPSINNNNNVALGNVNYSNARTIDNKNKIDQNWIESPRKKPCIKQENRDYSK